MVSYKVHLLELYMMKHGSDCKFYHCYEFAKDKPKFMSLFKADTRKIASGVKGATGNTMTPITLFWGSLFSLPEECSK